MRLGSTQNPAGPRRASLVARWLTAFDRGSWGTRIEDYDPAAVLATVRHLRAVFGKRAYFRLDARGFESLPPPPVLLVSNHSGGTVIPDVWGFLAAWYRHFSAERPVHPLGHELIFSNRLSGAYFARRGVLCANPRLAQLALQKWRRDVFVTPGGDLDAWKPYWRQYEVCFAGRRGYARTAIAAGVPIVPVANAGAHETLLILTDGRALARALRFHVLARADILPLHLSFPWGLCIGPWPHIPLPARLRYRVGDAIVPPPRLGDNRDDHAALLLDARVRSALQTLLNGLRDEMPYAQARFEPLPPTRSA